MKKRLQALVIIAGLAAAQNPNTAVFPSGVASDSDLFVASNRASSTLAGAITNTATSFTVASGDGAKFTAPVIVAIESEILHCTTRSSDTISGCTRGAEGTTAASHGSGVAVYGFLTAWHTNQLAAEIKAIEAHLPSLNGPRMANGTSADTEASASNISGVMDCIAGSSSGTAYSCSTSPSFSPASGDSVWFKADVANTGSATLNVNSGGAKTIKKLGGSSSLSAGDLASGQWTQMTYDGTNWQMQGQVANAPSGGTEYLPTVYQFGASARASGNTLTTYTFPANSVSGNIVIACLDWEGGTAGATTFSDNHSSTYIKAFEISGDTNANIAVWIGTLAAGGSTTFTFSFPSGSYEGMSAIEFSPTNLTTTVDVTGTVKYSNNQIGNNVITTTQDGDLIYWCTHSYSSAGNWQVPVGFTFISYTSGQDASMTAFYYQHKAGPINVGGNGYSIGTVWREAAVAFKSH